MEPNQLTHDLLERVLEKLGFDNLPENDLSSLSSIYENWCLKVPFDNLQKRLFFTSNSTGELPGTTAQGFFTDWLKYGTGGTCWAASNAIYQLLGALGFDAALVTATMMTSPDVRGPNHGTVFVKLDEDQFMIDGSMLTHVPVILNEEGHDKLHPASKVHYEFRDGGPQIFWRSLHRKDGVWCRIDDVDTSAEAFQRHHERTRIWSPFNYSAYARINTATGVKGVSFGERVNIGSDYVETREPISFDKICEFLVDEVGISEELIAELPVDTPMEPPPKSRQ